MAFDVVMPQMGESIAEATILKWHRAAGEAIGKDETLYEISTDKVDAEIPSPIAGVLLEVLVPENHTVPVGTIVARIGVASEKPQASATLPSMELVTSITPPAAILPRPQEDDNSLEARLATKSSPLVRKMAEVHGVDLLAVKGTGLLGRVTKEDMEAHLAAPSTSATLRSEVAPLSHDPSAPTLGIIPALAAPVVPHIPAFAAGERVKVEPMTRMRKLIAENMVASKHTSPHVYTVFEIDMTNVAKLRQKHRVAFEEAYGTKLSFMPFIMMAACKALRAFPVINASVDGDKIVYKQDIHLGIAVSLDWGLIVPVVKNADQLNLGGLAKALNDLAERSRAKQLKPDEISGGTFTITNPGVYGDVFGLPVINQPQVAIQGVGAIQKRAVVLTAPDGTDSIAIRQMVFSSLSFDHRIVDGAVADQFMSLIKKELETSHFGLQ